MAGNLLAVAYWHRIDGGWYAFIDWSDDDVTLHGPYDNPAWCAIHQSELRS